MKKKNAQLKIINIISSKIFSFESNLFIFIHITYILNFIYMLSTNLVNCLSKFVK